MKRYRISALMRTLNRRPMALEEADTPAEALKIGRGYEGPLDPAIQIEDKQTGELFTTEQFAARHGLS